MMFLPFPLLHSGFAESQKSIYVRHRPKSRLCCKKTHCKLGTNKECTAAEILCSNKVRSLQRSHVILTLCKQHTIIMECMFCVVVFMFLFLFL